MCGRYALGIRAAFVRYQLQQQQMPVDDGPDDEEARESYNFAPGYFGLVYRAESSLPVDGASTAHQNEVNEARVRLDGGNADQQAAAPKYRLQAMKWGLVPFWTKRNPDYGTLMRTINCRDDSLEENRGMWTSMKKTKRCLVIAQGFYEWLKKNDGREKIPHFIKRKDGQLMLLAGLWDRVRYEDSDSDLWSYTIITTMVNKQLSFIHDRMPVILEPNSEQMWRWLDPQRTEWTPQLQSLLQPYQGELECYAVSKDVGKVGNNSPDFIVPVASAANKQNIANFFRAQKNKPSAPAAKNSDDPKSSSTKDQTIHDDAPGEDSKRRVDILASPKKLKRAAEDSLSPPKKIAKGEGQLSKQFGSSPGKQARDPTSNGMRPKVSPSKAGSAKSAKITSFFAKS